MQAKTVETTAPQGRSTEFVPVEGGAETTSAEMLLVVAYLVMWALLIGFVLMSWRRQQRIAQRLSELERALGGSTGAAKG